MKTRERIDNIIIYVVFSLYIAFLFKLLIMSRFSGFDLSNRVRTFNLVPFHSIELYARSSTGSFKAFAISNVLGNIIAFVPLGVAFMVFRSKKSVIKSTFQIFLISVLAEVVQWFLAIGVFDIDDIILNTTGGLLGVLTYKIMYLILKDETKVKSLIAVLCVLGSPVLYFLLFKIKLAL